MQFKGFSFLCIHIFQNYSNRPSNHAEPFFRLFVIVITSHYILSIKRYVIYLSKILVLIRDLNILQKFYKVSSLIAMFNE